MSKLQRDKKMYRFCVCVCVCVLELTGSGEGGGKAGASGSVDYVVSSKWARDPDINLKIRYD